MYVFKGTRFQAVIKRFHSVRGPSPEVNFVFSAIWVIASLLTVLIPLIYRTIHKRKYDEIYMDYYWEQEYEYYEEQRQKNYEKYGNNWNYGGAYMYNNNMERQYMDVNQCKWWQLNCFSYYVNQDGEPVPEQGWYPRWYSGWTVSEEERQDMEDNREQPGSLKFVYVWQIFMFIAIIGYGLVVIGQNRNPTGLIIALLVWTNYAFMSMWLMADGSIVTDGEIVKRFGFYGQLSVLIFMSNFWFFLHGLAFIIVFWTRACFLNEEQRLAREEKAAAQKLEAEQKALAATSQQGQSDDASDGYKAPAAQLD